MKLKKEFVIREVAGDYLLVPVGQTALSLNGMMILNDTGAFLWEKLPEAADEAALVDTLLEEFEVDRPTAEADVKEFLDQLRELEIL